MALGYRKPKTPFGFNGPEHDRIMRNYADIPAHITSATLFIGLMLGVPIDILVWICGVGYTFALVNFFRANNQRW